MAIRHLVIVQTASGLARTEWRGDDANGTPQPKPDSTLVDCTSGAYGPGPFAGMTWTGAVFVPTPLAPIRQITSGAWWDRWTDAEVVKLEQLAEANTNAGRQVRAFFRAVQLSGAIDLDKPALATKLGQLGTLMISDGIWADQAAADARIAALLAVG